MVPDNYFLQKQVARYYQSNNGSAAALDTTHNYSRLMETDMGKSNSNPEEAAVTETGIFLKG